MRPTTLPNTAEEEAREPAMATDELLQEQRKSAGVRLSSSMPALAPDTTMRVALPAVPL